MRKLLVLLLVCILGGCATAGPVVPFGPDTYKISQDGGAFSTCIMSKGTTSTIQRANKYCQRLGKNFMPISSYTGICSYDLTFRCLDEGDPELKRPDIEFTPDVVVEDRKE